MNGWQFVVISMVSAAGVAANFEAAAAEDWPQFQGPQRNGISQETGLATAWPEDGPRELWSMDVGPGYGGAAIVGGEVYVLDRIDNKTDILRCLSLNDGVEQWSYSYEAPGSVGHTGSRTPPTVDEKYVYTVGLMGDFLCVDRATHQPVWRHDLRHEFDVELPNWGFSQSPLLYKNLVIIAVQGPDAFAVGFDRNTGAIVWKSPAMGSPAYVSPIVTTLAGTEQIVVLSGPGDGGGAAGISPEDGSLLWKYEGWECKIPIPSPTPIGEDKLFITGGYDAGSAMIQIVKSGEGFAANEVKKIDAKEIGVQIQQPIFFGGYLYAGNSSNERELGLTCLAPDGTVKWRTSDNEEWPSIERGPFIIADGKLIALDGRRGTLHLAEVGPEGYRELARAKVLKGRELWGPLAFSDGKLIVRSQTQMRCLDLRNP